jgi:hypothetical protein
MPRKYKNGFASVIILILVIIGIGAFVVLKNGTSLNKNPITNENAGKSGLQIKADILLDGDKKLFYDVTNVLEARYGPDLNTIHFKLKNHERFNQTAECVMLENLIVGTNPWAYPLIGQSETLPQCPGGYLHNANAFAYIHVLNNKPTLYIEDESKKLHTIPLSDKLAKQLLEKNGANHGTESYKYDYTQVLSEIKSKNKKDEIYFYPHDNSFIVKDKLLLSFGMLILAVDLQKDMILGDESMKDYQVIADSYWIESSPDFQLGLIQAAWEGPMPYQAVLDFSGSTLKATPLYDLDKTAHDMLGLRKFEWNNGGLNLTLFEEKDVTNEVKDIESTLNYDDSGNSTQYESAETKAEERLHQKYDNVVCTLSPGIVQGCFVYLDIAHYLYLPEGTITKI